MAREAGARTEHWATKLFPPAQFLMTPAELERFAALVAAAEREAIAAHYAAHPYVEFFGRELADEIRARLTS